MLASCSDNELESCLIVRSFVPSGTRTLEFIPMATNAIRNHSTASTLLYECTMYGPMLSFVKSHDRIDGPERLERAAHKVFDGRNAGWENPRI